MYLPAGNSPSLFNLDIRSVAKFFNMLLHILIGQ